MRSAAMKIRSTTTADFVVCMTHARYRAWRKQVETFKAIEGARAVLEHVPDAAWVERFAVNEDAFSAVVSELAKVAD